jgi:FxsC-like protein
VPVFDAFFSYARDDFSPYMAKFYADLAEEVRLLLGRAKADPILFRDEQDIGLGTVWRSELTSALHSTRVLISVQTPRYFSRPYCGKEVGVTLRREARLTDSHDRVPAVIPINWCPCTSLPAVISQYQQSHAELPRPYATHGLLVLVRNDKYRNEYSDCLRFLASRIAESVRQTPPLPELDSPLAFDEAPDAFQQAVQGQASSEYWVQTQGPRSARFCYAVATRPELSAHKPDCSRYDHERREFWRPFTNSPAVGILASRIAVVKELVPDLLWLDDSFLGQLARACDQNNLVVLVVDAWTLDKVEPYRRAMEACDGRPSTHCAVIVVWNQEDPDTEQCREVLERRVAATFPILSSRDPTYFRAGLASAPEFEAAVSDTLNRLQARVIAYGEIKRSLTAVSTRPIPVLENVWGPQIDG